MGWASSLANKYWTRLEVNGSGKHSSYYDTATITAAKVIYYRPLGLLSKTFTPIIP
jgi:hypothetical protein